jgi:SnoaL-like domain
VTASSTPEEAIRRTLGQYGQLCDDGRWGEWADLFVEDARFHVMGETKQGREVIKGYISESMPPEVRGKHAMLTSVITLQNERAAAAWTDFVFVDQRRKITSVGRYHDELALGDDGRWRFTLREIVFLGDQPQQAQPVPG